MVGSPVVPAVGAGSDAAPDGALDANYVRFSQRAVLVMSTTYIVAELNCSKQQSSYWLFV